MSGVITPSGAKSKLALGLQSAFGTHTKGTHIAEYRSGGLRAARANAYSQALRDTPSTRIKGQVTDFEASGSINLELTPEGIFPMVLTSLLGAPTSTTYYADVTGSPTTWAVGTTYAEDAKVLRNSYYYTSVANGNVGHDPACDAAGTYWTAVPDVTSGITANLRAYKHVWKHNWNQRYISSHQLKGSAIESFVDAIISSFSMSVSKGTRDVISASIDARACNAFIADEWTDVVESGAGADTLPPWSAVHGKILLNDISTSSFREFSFGVNRSLSDKQVLNGYLGPAGFNHGASETSGSLNAYFDSEDNLYSFMGHASAYTKPAGFTGDLVYQDVKLQLSYKTPGAGGSPLTYENKLEIHFPNCLFGAVEQPVNGREEIMQSIVLEPCYDTTEETDVIITLWNRQTNASILTSGATITPPCSAVQQV